MDIKKFEQLDIAGDAGLRIKGAGLEDLFKNAATGMNNLITDTDAIRVTDDRRIHLEADNIEDLFVRWLNELVFLFDTHGFIGKQFDILVQGNTLTAAVSGGMFDHNLNEKKLLIKAATYHCLSLRQEEEHWEATVIFDI